MKTPQQKPKIQSKPTIHVQRRTSKQPKLADSSPQQVLQRAISDPRSLSHEDVLQLQRTIGNQATRKILSDVGQKHPVQATSQSRELLQRKGFWGKAFDRAFGVEAHRAKLYKGSVPQKTKVPLLGAQKGAEYQPYMNRRAGEKGTLQYAYRKDGAQAQSVQLASESGKKVPFLDILNSPLAYLAFKDYLDGEYSSEIYMFLDEALKGQVMKLKGDYKFTIKEAIYLYKTYIGDPSVFQNNISSRTRNKLKETMPEMESKRGFTGFRQAPAKAQLAIRTAVDEVINMTRGDTYGRFVFAENYRYAKMWAERDRKQRLFDQANQRTWKEFLFS